METEKDKQKGGVTVKKEKWMAGATMLAMCVCLLFPVSVNAQEQTSGPITTQVPETHKATLTIVGKGTVTVNGQTCEGEVSHMEVKIPRLTETEWKFSPADGYTLEEVLYNGTDVTEEVTDYTYHADPVNEDGTEVKVVFTEKNSGTTGSDPSGSGNQQSGSDTSTSGGTSGKDSPKTGDDTPISLWMGAMTVSAVLAAYCLVLYRKKKA